jgi:hypothetical protein
VSGNQVLTKSNPFVVTTYILFFLCLTIASIVAQFDFRVAMLMVALVFGWVQIGGV